ncbi:phage tail protein, partial [Erwinia amylovora]|nr:phage tail protein [Erwinia amylovora]
YFGQGSELALMCRAAIAAGRKAGNIPELWACPINEPGGGTAATYTLTVTGPATASGNVVLSLLGHKITVGVTSGDSATTVAAA